jgi:DNA-binding transcriptional MerR regulator
MNKDGVTINELSKMASVTVRTIRFYTDEGVLDEPAGRDRYARYTRRHYLQLNAARTLKERFLPLRVIRDQMASMSESELERLAGPVPAAIDARFNDAEGIESATAAHVIAAQQLAPVASMRHQLRAFAPAENDLSAKSLNESDFDFLSNTVHEETLKPTFAMQSNRGFVRQSQPTQPATTTSDVWHRIVISPSMELHVREDGMQEAGEIRRILASLRKR